MPQPRANASPSTRGTIYQLCSAVQAGFELVPGQRLLIEEFGDLTVPGDHQTEVKHYNDSLTDGHTNFWNTLYNWYLGGTDVGDFQKLILSTTQQFGARARIAGWNALSDEQRLALLTTLHMESEQRFAGEPPGTRIPSVLFQQRELLSAANRAHLHAVVKKVVIDAGQPVMSTLFSELANSWFRAVPEVRRTTALNSLIGFVCRPDMPTGSRWEINYEDFNKEYADLVRSHAVETREFPQAAFNRLLETPPSIPSAPDPFIRKITDIEHHRRVPAAIRDYHSAIETIDQEFREYTGNHARLRRFSQMVTERFELTYENACMGAATDNGAARQFYNTTMNTTPPNFAGYLDSPDWFRNGLLHALMNDEEQSYQWKLVAP
jgi:hypothetical protein